MDRVFTGLEVRAEGRTVAGAVMRWGEISPSHRERFLPGSLQLSGDVWLDIDHDPRAIVAYQGGGLTFTETEGALELRAEVPRTVPGEEALNGVRDGSRAGLSVEFKSLKEHREAQTGIRVIESARLAGVGLVARPSYVGSQVELRQRTGPAVTGQVALGRRIACQCRDGCDAVEIMPAAFDAALAEVADGAREIPVFFSGNFDTPLARVGNGLTVERQGNQLPSPWTGCRTRQGLRSSWRASRTAAATASGRTSPTASPTWRKWGRPP